MTTLRDASLNYSPKKELHQLQSVPVDIEIIEDTFKNEAGADVKYKYVEINGYRYTINKKSLAALKNIVAARPSVKNVKFEKAEDGSVFVVPLD